MTLMKKTRTAGPDQVKLGKLFAKLRKERGFDTAYAFFHKNGGHGTFGFSYHHYLLIEKGSRLPSQAGLEAIVDGLGGKAALGNDWIVLGKTFLAATFQGDSFFEEVLVKTPGHGIERIVREKSGAAPAPQAPAQAQVVMSGTECFWLHHYLLATGQTRPLGELADLLGLKAADAAAAVTRLREAGLVAESKEGLHSSHFENGLTSPARLNREQGFWVHEQLTKMFKRSGEMPLYARRIVADENGDLRETAQSLARELVEKIRQIGPSSTVNGGTLVALDLRIGSLLELGE